MSRNIIRINPLTSTLWMDFITHHHNSTIFHHPLWLSLLHQQYGYVPLAYCVVDEKGVIQAGIPFMLLNKIFKGRCLISLPFTDYCFPLFYDEDSLRFLLEYLIHIQNKDSFNNIEIRYNVPEINHLNKSDDFVLHTLKLTSNPNNVFQTFKKTQVQQCIRKAERESVKIRFERSKFGIDVFYILHTFTRKRLGVPVQPKLFFNLFWRLLIKSNMGFVLLAFLDNVPISGSVFLNFGSTVTYKYSASDPKYWNLRPNNLVLWNAIQWACSNGYAKFDFGKSEVANTGLRDFKDGWGTIEEPLPYSYISNEPIKTVKSNSNMGKIAEKVIQKSPTFICRLTGELLYKYFG